MLIRVYCNAASYKWHWDGCMARLHGMSVCTACWVARAIPTHITQGRKGNPSSQLELLSGRWVSVGLSVRLEKASTLKACH